MSRRIILAGPLPGVFLEPWTEPLQSDLEDLALGYKATNLPQLHGRTTKGEVCKCMPGSIEQGVDLLQLQNVAKIERTRSHAEGAATFKAASNSAKDKIDPVMRAAEAAGGAQDEAFRDLLRKAIAAEQGAERLQAAYQDLRAAHSRGGCAELAHRGESGLRCATALQGAEGDLEQRAAAAQPSCRDGAATLSALRRHDRPLQAACLHTLPPTNWPTQRCRGKRGCAADRWRAGSRRAAGGGIAGRGAESRRAWLLRCHTFL